MAIDSAPYASYLKTVAKLSEQAEATPELSLREPLLVLIREAASRHGRRLLIAPEANAEQAGQPDVFVKDGPRLVGFVETKAPGANLAQLFQSDQQLKRYRESLPNWILTDYYTFHLVRDGKLVDKTALAPPGSHHLPSSRGAQQLDALLAAFFGYVPPVIRSPRRLALELGRRARLLRDGLAGALAEEPEDGQLTSVLAFYRQTLMSDLDEAGFADTFAQTLVYGMFLGRLRHPDAEFRRALAADAIPESVPFLRSAVRLLTSEDLLPEAITRLLDDLAALLANTDVKKLRDELAAGGLERDLVVYFYERFLEQYDKGERRKRGVYYTAPELVGYLTRATEQLLQREFGLDRGLADRSVVLLDPATGTGTFLLGMAERALEAEAPRGSASQRKLVRDHLLRNFVGFELLPAPYAVAHLKLSSFYEHMGHSFGSEERLPIYLTNSLQVDDGGDRTQMVLLPMLRGIIEEAKAADRVKEATPILVIVGNPPYERTSHNANPHSDALLEDFYSADGVKLEDRNTGPLRDDYLRFIRWSVWKLLEQDAAPGHGILALVTNRAFIERKLHRGVRRFLLDRFDDIYTFDLHGDQREWFRDRVDEKVFKDVQAGIALTVFVKREEDTEGLATVHYRETFGTREEKMLACQQAELTDPEWKVLNPRKPLWLFVPYEVPPAYDAWPTLTQLFPQHVVGVQTHRDQLVVGHTKHELEERLRRFADLTVPDSEWIEQKIKSNRDWKLKAARRELAAAGPSRLLRWVYRPFDRRWVAFDERLIDYTRTQVSPHMLEDGNLALVFAHGSLTDGPYAFVSRTPVPAACLSWRTFGSAYFAPLRLHGGLDPRPESNVPETAIGRLKEIGVDVGAQDVLEYVYAVLNAPSYRSQFAHGLRYDFAKIPISSDPEVFNAIRQLGAELVQLHLLEHPGLEEAAPLLDGDDQAIIESPGHDGTGSVRLGSDLTAHPISAAVWAYQQGAYRVLPDYLNDRLGRPLSAEEFADFRLVVGAVAMTVDLLPEIDRELPRATATAVRRSDLGFPDPP